MPPRFQARNMCVTLDVTMGVKVKDENAQFYPYIDSWRIELWVKELYGGAPFSLLKNARMSEKHKRV